MATNGHSQSSSSHASISRSERVIVALDMDDLDKMKDFVTTMGDDISFYKVGYRLFMKYHFAPVDFLQNLGKRVFLDLKLGDIGETVHHAVMNIPRDKEIDFLTVNSSPAGVSHVVSALCKRENSDRPKTQCLFVTRLSSDDDISDDMLPRRVSVALLHGARGFVASGNGVALVRACDAHCCIVAPGIRAESGNHDDHKHRLTAKKARDHGADYIVVGRPITQAQDPLEAFHGFLDDFS